MASSAVRAGRAFVEIYGVTEKLDGALKSAENQVRQFVQKVGLITSAAGAASSAVLFSTISKASDQAESLNAFKEVFRGANMEAERLASTLSERLGRSVTNIAKGMTPIGAMVRGLGLAGDEAARFSAAATEAALDISSFFNTGTEESFARLRSALSGSSEAVDQFGINLRQQALEMKLTEMGFAGNVQAASELEKTLARLAIVQDSLANSGAGGDLERTKDQYANLARTVSDSFRELYAAAGKALLPVAEFVLQGLVPLVQTATQFIDQSPMLIQAIAAISAVAAGGGLALAAMASSIAVSAVGAIYAVGQFTLLVSWLSKTTIGARAAAAAMALLNNAMVLTAANSSRFTIGTVVYTAFSLATRAMTVFTTGAITTIAILGKLAGAATLAIAPYLLLAAAISAVAYAGYKLSGVSLSSAERERGSRLDQQVAEMQARRAKEGQAGGGPAGGGEQQIDPGELARFADRIKRDIQSPAEEFASTLKMLDAALKSGLITQEEYNRKIAQSKDDQAEAEKFAFENTLEGQRAKEIKDFADRLKEETKTAEEKFADQMAAIGNAFHAGQLTAEEAQRGLDAASQSLADERQKIEDEAKRAFEQGRKDQLAGIDRTAEKRIAVSRAIGGDKGDAAELEALRRQFIDQRGAGFQDEAFDTLTKYLGGIIERSDGLDKKIADQRDQADMITGSAREAIFGLGTKTIDEQLLKEQKDANKKSDAAKGVLDKILTEIQG